MNQIIHHGIAQRFLYSAAPGMVMYLLKLTSAEHTSTASLTHEVFDT